MNMNMCVIAALAICTVAGCGGGVDRGPLGTLEGTVTFEGTPLTEGMIYLKMPDGKGAGGGEIGADGTFVIAGGAVGGIPTGTYTVWFAPPMVEVSRGENEAPDEQPKEMPNMPEKYRSASTSGLTVEITEGSNTKDFDLVP